MEFNGTMASVCEYLEIMPFFNERVRELLKKIRVTGIECDSRRVTRGTIFYAKRGQHYNPFEHLEEIKAKGAIAILVDSPSALDCSRFGSAPNYDRLVVNEDPHQVLATVRTAFEHDSHTASVVQPEEMSAEVPGDFAEAIEESEAAAPGYRKNRIAPDYPVDDRRDEKAIERARRRGELVIASDNCNQNLALFAYHSLRGTEEAKAISEVHMLRLVLPPHKSLSALAGFIYGEPSQKLRLIGVTGTNGKSTITTLIAQMLEASGHHCAVFGTLGYGFLNDMQKSSNTTLDPISLQRELAHYVELGADYAVLEVSSIGLCENRVSGLHFYAGGFSNLSRDHLDYHKTMEDYYESKLNFMRMVPPSRAVINFNSADGRRIAETLKNCYQVGVEYKEFEKSNGISFVNCKRVVYNQNSLELYISSSATNKKIVKTVLPLLGEFNAENFMVAMGIMMAMGFDCRYVASLAPKLRPVTGRMECFSKPNKPLMVVDYAHTPDGVEQALRAARRHTQEKGRIFVVVGCGGDRDTGKRPIMAMKAALYADFAIFTADNPRSENLVEIIEDMLLGVAPASMQRFLHATGEWIAQQREEQKQDSTVAVDLYSYCAHDKFYNKHVSDLSPFWSGKVPVCLPSPAEESKNVIVIHDRRSAIEYAFAQANEHDCIIVAGKGHEDYQILNDKTIHFSDREICCELLGLELPPSSVHVAEIATEKEEKAPVKTESLSSAPRGTETENKDDVVVPTGKAPTETNAKTPTVAAKKPVKKTVRQSK